MRNAAIEQTVRAERGRLFDFIKRRVRTVEDAEDILQDVFAQLVINEAGPGQIEQLTSWLFTVARNRIIDWYRKKRPDSLPASAENPALPLNLEDILFDPTENPERIFARSAVWTELASALDELPEDQRWVFVQHELEGRSFKELAEETGDPINTLLSRKRYAVLHLRERLQDLYDSIESF